jgi:threonine aldolase
MLIDLRSDTVTRPTAGMRRAIASAEVGDDYLDGDPTTRRLEEQVAQLLGKDRALFFPSGTMANQCAIAVLSERGTEIYADQYAHIVEREMAGAAALSGVQVRTVRSEGPMMDASSLSRAFRPFDPYLPRASLVCLENTHNSAGGLVTPSPGCTPCMTWRANAAVVFISMARACGTRRWPQEARWRISPSGVTR